MILDRFNRWQAALIHLGISVVIAALVVCAMLLLWYPPPYFQAAGGQKLLVLLVGVDVVLGPLLTLLVYDPRKKSLRWDLAAIALLQLAALLYGAWIMFNARPVYIAFAGDRFELVEANAIDPEDQAKAARGYRILPLAGPMIVGTRLPTDPAERDRLGMAGLFGGSIGLFPQHYVPYAEVAASAIGRGQPLSKLRAKYPDRAASIDAGVAGSGAPEATLRYVPMQARHGDMTVIIDAATGAVRGVLAIDPW